MNTKGIFSHKTDEWSTPQDIFDELNNEFGFDLDPCSTDENYKCERHYTIADDGLSYSWGGAEYSVIHLTATYQDGLRKPTEKPQKTTHLLFYLYHQGRTHDTFITSSIIGQR